MPAQSRPYMHHHHCCGPPVPCTNCSKLMHTWLGATHSDEYRKWEAILHVTAMGVQAWPKDDLEVQPERGCLSESQTPSHWEERSTSASAHEDLDQPRTELQVRMLMTTHSLLKHCHASALPALHASSTSLRPIVSLDAQQQAHAHLAGGTPCTREQAAELHMTAIIVQAWPPPPPPPPKRRWLSEPPAPSQAERQGTLVAADGGHCEKDPPHSELQVGLLHSKLLLLRQSQAQHLPFQDRQLAWLPGCAHVSGSTGVVPHAAVPKTWQGYEQHGHWPSLTREVCSACCKTSRHVMIMIVQAWPPPHPSPPRRSWPSAPQSPSQGGTQGTSAAAAPEAAAAPPLQQQYPEDGKGTAGLRAPPSLPPPKRSWPPEPSAPSQAERQGTLVAADGGHCEKDPPHSELQVGLLHSKLLLLRQSQAQYLRFQDRQLAWLPGCAHMVRSTIRRPS